MANGWEGTGLLASPSVRLLWIPSKQRAGSTFRTVGSMLLDEVVDDDDGASSRLAGLERCKDVCVCKSFQRIYPARGNATRL